MKNTGSTSAPGASFCSRRCIFYGHFKFCCTDAGSGGARAGTHRCAQTLRGTDTRFSADMGGAVISRSGGLSAAQELVCLAAGPGGGLIYALAVSFVGGGVLLCSAGMSLVLSFFNLLPCLPLDGGRMVETIFGEKTAALCGLITASAVFVTGFALFTGGSGPALFLPGRYFW